MRWAGPNSNLTLAVCASTVLAGCTSPLGRVRYQRPGELTRRLDPNYKRPNKPEQTQYSSTEFSTDFPTDKPKIKTPPLEKVAGHLLKEYITRVYYEDEWPYQVWKFGDEVSDWIDENLLQFDFYGFKGHITLIDDEIGILFSTEF